MQNSKLEKISYQFYLIMLLFLFEPNAFVKISVLNYLFIIGAVVSFLVIFLKYIKYKFPIDNVLIILICWRLLSLFVTFIYGGDILKVGYQSLIFITLFMYAKYFIKKKSLKMFWKNLLTIFFTYLIVNILSYSLFPNGIIHNSSSDIIYFLGIRTRFTEYALATILLGIINYKYKQINLFYLAIVIIIALLNIMLPNISTAYTGIAIIIISYFILYRFYHKKKVSSFKPLLIIALIFTFLIVFLRAQNVFEYFIVNVLNKQLTLSNRTVLWDLSYKYILNGNWLFGNGYINDGNFIALGSTKWQAHDQFLQMLYECGITGTFLFYLFISKILGKSKRVINKLDMLIVSFVFAFLIMMISEIYSYYIPFYVVLVCCYCKDHIYKDLLHWKKGEKNEKSSN